MTKEKKLLEKINQEKNLYTIYHGLKTLWVDMDYMVARAVYYTADYEDAYQILEYLEEGEYGIEEAIYEVVGYDWFQQHCSNTEYLDENICNELMEN